MGIDADLRQNLAELKAIAGSAPLAVEKVANEVAKAVRNDAARHGHAVGVRVVRRTSGVRVTITGPQASRYRVPLEKALREKAPQAQAEIRAMITRRPK